MNDLFIVAIIAAIPGCLAAFLAYLTGRNVKNVKHEINSRFTEMILLAKESSLAKGILQGSEERHELLKRIENLEHEIRRLKPPS